MGPVLAHPPWTIALLAAALWLPPPGAAATTSARIYKGTPTTAHPAVVAVGIRNSDGAGGLCSGTLVAPSVVLTAGHCLAFDPVAAAIAIFPDGVTEVDIRVARWEVHPDFDVRRIAVADIAALVLETPVTDVTPVGLVSAAPRRGTRGAIVGFGDDDDSGLGVKRAGRVRLTRCPRAVRRIGILPGQLDGSLCWRPRPRGQDTCLGDSGGPLLVDGLLAGVTSGGFPDCPGRLSWDTSIAAVRGWIDDVLARAATP
jgi:hypothetical protein